MNTVEWRNSSPHFSAISSNYIAIRYHLSYNFQYLHPTTTISKSNFVLQGAGVSRIAGPPGRPLRFSSSSSSAEGNTPDLSKQTSPWLQRVVGKFLEMKWCWGWKDLGKNIKKFHKQTFFSQFILLVLTFILHIPSHPCTFSTTSTHFTNFHLRDRALASALKTSCSVRRAFNWPSTTLALAKRWAQVASASWWPWSSRIFQEDSRRAHVVSCPTYRCPP